MENEKIQLLVVEKDKKSLDLIKPSLEKIDFFSVEFETNPETALEKANNTNYDIILIDQNICLANEIDIQQLIIKDKLLPIIIYLSDSPQKNYNQFDETSNIFDHIGREEVDTITFQRTLYYAAILAKFEKKKDIVIKECQDKLLAEKDSALRTIRHDLNNMLAMLLGNIELLLYGKYNCSEKVKKKLEALRNVALEMMEKLKQLK